MRTLLQCSRSVPFDCADDESAAQQFMRALRCNSPPAVCDLQEQHFSFVAAQSAGRSAGDRPPLVQAACKPPLPPASPGKATGSRSPKPSGLRRTASALASFHTNQPPHSAPPPATPSAGEGGSRCVGAPVHEDVKPSYSSLSVGTTDGFSAQLMPPAEHQLHDFTSDNSHNCDRDEPSPLDQLLLDPDLMSLDHALQL